MALIDLPPYYIALAPLAGFPDVARPQAGKQPKTGTLKHLAGRFLAWRAQRETVRMLNSVDPATLRDLGITDIESQVYGDPKDRMRGYDRDWWKRH
jgi:uncharacterized protein YjiS (DUF1127 family)